MSSIRQGIFVMLVTLAACSSQPEVNPLENETELDCRNLRIRKVELIKFINAFPHQIQVTMENTCKNCEDNWVYLELKMIDRQTQDTIAASNCVCLLVVKNGTSGIYRLSTEREALPDLKNIRFSYSYLCDDVPYQPRVGTAKLK